MKIKHRVFLLFFAVFLFAFSQVNAREDSVEALLNKVEANLLVDRELAWKLANHAENLINRDNLLIQKARLFNLQSHLYILNSELNEAFAKALEAEKYAVSQSNEMQQAEAIRRKGIINYLLGFDGDAIEFLRESLSIHRKLSSPYELNNLQSIGNVYNRNALWTDELIEIGSELVEKSVKAKNEYLEEQGYSFITSGLLHQDKKQGFESDPPAAGGN